MVQTWNNDSIRSCGREALVTTNIVGNKGQVSGGIGPVSERQKLEGGQTHRVERGGREKG